MVRIILLILILELKNSTYNATWHFSTDVNRFNRDAKLAIIDIIEKKNNKINRQ